MSRIIGAENVSGAEDHLEKAQSSHLKVVHGGKELTYIEVVEAIRIIQQRT